MKKLLLILLSLIGSIYGSESPLSQQSTICFVDGTEFGPFEKAFREKYRHLDIPLIQVTDQACAQYSPTQKLIQFDPSQAVSLLNAEYTLLHETGHHNYPIEKRQKNIDYANRIVNNGLDCTETVLVGCKRILTVANGYHLLFRKPHIPLLLAQGIIMELAQPQIVISAFDATVYPMLAVRPEEHAADAFANEHATRDVLLAEQYKESQEGFLGDQEFLNVIVKRQQTDPENLITYQARCAACKIYGKMGAALYYLQGLSDLAHPSDYQRHKIISKTLQDRFGVEA